MSFPTTIDSIKNNWIAGETRSWHASHHNSIANLLLAIQNKIWVNGSTDPTSIQYFISNHSHASFYTKTEVDSALAGKQSTIGFVPENSSNRWAINGYAPIWADWYVPQQYINLSNIWKYYRTAQLWEAIPSSGYGLNAIKTFSTAWSNSWSFTVMGGRVRFDKRTKIVSVKYPHNASNGSAAIVIYSNANVLLGTYSVPNWTKEATWINFVCEPGIDYQIWCNSTTNFGSLHANQTLTAQNISDGFISGCYGFGNFDATWRLQEVVIQSEEPSVQAVSIVNRIQYDFTYTQTSASSASREWVRFVVPYDVLLREVRTHVTASTSTAVILLLDSLGNTLTSQAMASGSQTVNFWGFALTAGTEYRLVMNDTANWGGTRYYGSVAQFQSEFPYAISGISGAGAGTVDNSNILNIKYIELDFQWKAFLSRANRPASEPHFCEIDGFVSGPKAKNDTVTLEANKNSLISWFQNLVSWGLYYLTNTWGTIGLTPWSQPVNVGRARSATQLEITSDGFPVTLLFWDTTTWWGNNITVFTRPRFVNEGLVRYTLTANTWGNNGMQMQWSETWDKNGTWYNIWETSGSTLSNLQMMVQKWFIRLREIGPANPYTASIQIWQ